MTERRDSGPIPHFTDGEGNYYRLYFMDRPGGRIGHVREFAACSDELAILHSEEALGSCPMELWSQDRKIKRWEPE